MTYQYLLDTNICIYITKNKPNSVLEKFKTLCVGDLGMSLITYGELLYGAEKSTQRRKVYTILEELIQFIPVLPLKNNVAEKYGFLRAYLTKKGEMIGNNDLWIAAHALAENLTLVTNNTREFNRIPQLKLENWV